MGDSMGLTDWPSQFPPKTEKDQHFQGGTVPKSVRRALIVGINYANLLPDCTPSFPRITRKKVHFAEPVHVEQPGYSEGVPGGAFGDVFVGTYRGSKVAVKTVRCKPDASIRHSRQKRKALDREVSIWQNLSHEHVQPILGLSWDVFPGTPSFISPWMANGNVRAHLNHLRSTKKGGDDFLTVGDVLLQVALGLSYLHEKRIVHGDLHGANILIDDRGDVRLTDFGMSVLDDGTAHGFKYGSMHRGGAARWQAPELLDPDAFGSSASTAKPTFKTDVWSFGCVAIELCTGKPPYDGVNDYQVIVQVLKGIKPPRPALPDGREMPDRLWSVTLACLQYLAADRPSSTSVADMLSTGYDPGVTSWENLKQS